MSKKNMGQNIIQRYVVPLIICVVVLFTTIVLIKNREEKKRLERLYAPAQPLSIKPNKWFTGIIDPYNTSVLESWVNELILSRPKTVKELERFMDKVDELDNKLSDTGAEIYIKMTCNTSDKEITKDYTAFQENIVAYYSPKENQFKKIIVESPAFPKWVKKQGKSGEVLQQVLKNDLELFREENVEIGVKLSALEVQFRAIIGNMSIKFQGKDQTMAAMRVFLEDNDRSVREAAWRARFDKMFEYRKELHALFDQMLLMRQEMAKNAGFDNFRDYMHQLKGRFSYTVDDVLEFQNAVEIEVMPVIEQFNEERRQKLGVDTLRPWDMSVSLDGKSLKPVEKPEELLPKHIELMYKIDPLFGHNIAAMEQTKLLDLFNRPNKAPGGYSYSLSKYGASFIFANSVGSHTDLTTLVHETGHAMHAFAVADHRFGSLYDHPMEASELASMSMEMISMDHWDIFYPNQEDLYKAKHDQIADAIRFFPWCVIVDGIQHRMYTDATTAELREKAFSELMTRFTRVDWSGLEKQKAIQWMFQLHIFEVPFYYIEYGICQLGALAVYREYRKDPKKAMINYKKFLNTGYRKPLSDIYKAAGIELKFTREYLGNIVSFVQNELASL